MTCRKRIHRVLKIKMRLKEEEEEEKKRRKKRKKKKKGEKKGGGGGGEGRKSSKYVMHSDPKRKGNVFQFLHQWDLMF